MPDNPKLPSSSQQDSSDKTRFLFKLIVLLACVAIAECFGLIWLYYRRPSSVLTTGDINLALITGGIKSGNLIRANYPDVDFTRFYPGWSDADIDRVQSESFMLRQIYAPFVGFRLQPVKFSYFDITEPGYRAVKKSQPWPPRSDAFYVFTFGGSTTLGIAVAADETAPFFLEEVLAKQEMNRTVQVYNFGAPSYFSTQERILFEQLLLEGIKPDLAIFIDGLNEFHFPDGIPKWGRALSYAMAPDIPYKPFSSLKTDEEKARAVEGLLRRYETNIQMAGHLCRASEVLVIFVGQPVPFFEYLATPEDYPFKGRVFPGNELCEWGYGKLKKAYEAGSFGESFIWCGDAFADARSPMYADSIHYTKAGAERLAEVIVARAKERNLLPVL